jgi:predicted nucleotidyltransferase
MLGREDIITAVQAALEGRADVRSLFEAGSMAFGRADEYSDIDLVVDVVDGAQEVVWEALEAALGQAIRAHSPACQQPIPVRKVIPEPAWHKMSQRFYKLAEVSQWLVLDVCLRPTSLGPHFGEVERHGTPRVLFDKDGLTTLAYLDQNEWREKVAARLPELADHFALFGNFAEKDLRRGRLLDAISMYHGLVLRPLVELLRIKHCPDRYDYGLRYLKYDLPADVVARLERLTFTADADALMAAQVEAREWAGELLTGQIQ